MGIRYEQLDDTGEAVPQGEDRSRWLPISERSVLPEWEWWHTPASWAHVPGLGWVPLPQEVYARPGANGVGEGRNLQPARVGMSQKGGVQLRRDAVPGGDYIRRHRTRTGRWHHTDRWTTFSVVGGRLVTKCDREARNRWLLSLVGGIIDLMPREVLDAMVGTQRHRIERLLNDPRVGNLAVETRLRAAKERLEAMESDWQRQFGAVTA